MPHLHLFLVPSFRFIAAGLLVGSALTIYPVCAEEAGWVHGSRVNVRKSSETNSAIVAKVTANTLVRIQSRLGEVCQIGWGAGLEGYVPCQFLGDRPLRLSEVMRPFLPDGRNINPQYSPSRGFWIAPSMASLFEAGRYFHQTALSSKQLSDELGYGEDGTRRGSEGSPPKLVRFPVSEFDAMKALLADGIVASQDHDPPLLTCAQMQEAYNRQLAAFGGGPAKSYWPSIYPNHQDFPFEFPVTHVCQVEALPNLKLPAIKPSFFKSSAEILPGSAGVERISAHFDIRERGRVLGSPKWERDYDTSRYTGAWDIGLYELTLETPVIEHVIGRTGLIGAYQWRPQMRVTPFGPSEGCAEGLRNRRMGKELVAGYPAIKDSLVWFQSTTALPVHKAKVTARSVIRPAPSARPMPEAEEGATAIKRAAVYEIDIDADGIPDLVKWDLWSASGGMLAMRMVFANIAGEWYPFDSDSYEECT